MLKIISCLLVFFMSWEVSAAYLEADIQLINFSSDHKIKIHQAIKLIKKVVALPEFKKRIINHTYGGQKTFVDNKGLTNEQIYDLILAGAEVLIPDKNSKMDLELELYQENNTTIGYTYPYTTKIWINAKYFNKYTPVQVADNLFHEWLHKLGFDHSLTYHQARNYSVPYAIGYLVEELAAKLSEP